MEHRRRAIAGRWARMALLLSSTAFSACSSESARVQLDLSALTKHAAQNGLTISQLVVEVSAPDISPPIRVDLDPAAPLFDVVLPAGTDRRFTATALSPVAGETRPSYWGTAAVDVPARSVVDLVIPASPAGTLEGRISAFGGDLPEGFTFMAVARAPKADLPGRFEVATQGGVFTKILPTGAYTFEARLDAEPQPLELVNPTQEVTVVQAEAADIALLLAPAGYCNAANPVDADADGSDCLLDCNDGDPFLNETDADSDGFSSCAGDCDDADPARAPRDDDLDGLSACAGDCDDTPLTGGPCTSGCGVFFADVDGDGRGDILSGVAGCVAPSGFVAGGDDCDDNNDQCGADCTDADGDATCRDTDCDDDPSSGAGCSSGCLAAFRDADGDSLGDPLTVRAVCALGSGWVSDGGDCRDDNPDCGQSCVDDDGDAVCEGNDCDDNPLTGAACSSTCVTFYPDLDGDGAGAELGSRVRCSAPPGFVSNVNDCDDTLPGCSTDCEDPDTDGYCGAADCESDNPNVHPGAPEVVADGQDQDCDGNDTCYEDADGDGYGSTSIVDGVGLGCTGPGLSLNDRDCDDNPTTGANFNWDDADRDGLSSCFGDCDDADPFQSPKAPENCNDGFDNNCDGLTDALPGTNPVRPADPACTQCPDNDGDGFHCRDCDDNDASRRPDDPDNDGRTSCEELVGDNDCAPLDFAARPGLIEKCNDGKDNDCDGYVDNDDGADCPAGCQPEDDTDGDGYFENESTFCYPVYFDPDDDNSAVNCTDNDRDGSSICHVPSDCDDTDRAAAPFPSVERCGDGIDNDCNGVTDAVDSGACGCMDNDRDGYECYDCDDGPVTGAACGGGCMLVHLDLDGDGWGATGTPSLACFNSPGFADRTGDCDDAFGDVHPEHEEICGDARNNDCLGGIDDRDQDRDGFVDANGSCVSAAPRDCDDGDFSRFPFDVDGDGLDSCTGDCDESNPRRRQGFAEVCDGQDNDCNGPVDDLANIDGDPVPTCQDNCPVSNNPWVADTKPTQVVLRLWREANSPVCDSTSAAYAVELNGSLVGSVSTAQSGTCCASVPDEHIFTVPGPATWFGDDRDVFRLVRAGASGELLVRASLLVQVAGPYELCLFDSAAGNNCMGPATGCDPTGGDFVLDENRLGRNPPQPDADGDGQGDACDCDDTGGPNGLTQPERCGDSVDNDCDGLVDSSDTADCPSACAYSPPPSPTDDDQDDDGYFRNFASCTPSAVSLDCDDLEPRAHPGIPGEVGPFCQDGIDNDCDSLADDQDPQAATDCAGAACDTAVAAGGVYLPAGMTMTQGSFDVCKQAAVPAAPLCGATGEHYYMTIDIGDPSFALDALRLCLNGSPSVEVATFSACGSEVCAGFMGGGCMDLFPTAGDQTLGVVFALTTEVCNGQAGPGPMVNWSLQAMDYGASFCGDADQDLVSDCVDPCIDADADGYGYIFGPGTPSCPGGSQPDCDDQRTTVHAGATEVCDGIDNDCNGSTDEGLGTDLVPLEGFESGFGAFGATMLSGVSHDWARIDHAVGGPLGQLGAFGSIFAGTNGNFGPTNPEESALVSPPFVPAGGGRAFVTFRSYNHNRAECSEDLEAVELATNGGAFQPLSMCPDPRLHQSYSGKIETLSYEVTNELSTATNAQLRFRFATFNGDGHGGTDDGWYVDDVRVHTCP